MSEPATARPKTALADPERFIREHTTAQTPPLVPEIRLHLATEVVPLWHLTEEELASTGLPPPFWAFAWAGGQALARYVLDHPETVRGRDVLDFGAGSGIVAIAAALAGARSVTATDIDPLAAAACRLNAVLNDVDVTVTTDDLSGRQPDADIVLVGDVCYERTPSARIATWLQDLHAAGVDILIGDPGRTYLPRPDLEQVTAYAVKTSRELEDTDVRNACVWRMVR